MEVAAVQSQLAQFGFQGVEINSEIKERANEHVAADAAEEVEVECFHCGG